MRAVLAFRRQGERGDNPANWGGSKDATGTPKAPSRWPTTAASASTNSGSTWRQMRLNCRR